jgi:DNA-binding GntR family transcriptional regulator
VSLEPSSVLPETIAEHLRASILDQVDAPGSTVTESAVALRYGVARPTARIAIERLVADGFLRREAHRAARVPELSRDDIIDLYDNRAVVEGVASAALARSRAIPAAALAAHRSLAEGARAGRPFARDDITFHRALVAGQPSPRLARMHSMLMGEIELGIGQVQAANLMTGVEVAEQHERILDAITAGDSALADTLAREHIAAARDRLLARWAEMHHPKGH